MKGDYALKFLEDLKPSDHLCCIYDDDDEHKRLVTPYMISGLEQNEKVLYIVDARTAETVLGYLRDAGVDVEPYLERGQLSILTANEAYMRTGTFDPDGMIELLGDETKRALEEGFSALRVTGEMSWALRGLPGSERLIEYEAKLNNFFPGSKCLAICQYDRRRFGPDVLLHVLSTHPIAVIGTELFDNFYFVPPEEFLSEEADVATLEHWLHSLAERKQAEHELRESEARFRELFEKSPVAIERYDNDGRLVEVNAACLEMFGVAGVDAIKGFDLFNDPNVTSDVKRKLLLGQGVRYEAPFDFEKVKALRLYETTRSGTADLDVHITPLRESGDNRGYLVLVQDVTEQKKYERALGEAERKYRELAESLPVVVFELDSRGTVTYTNKAGFEVFGYDPEDLPKGINALEMIDAADRDRVTGAILKMMDGTSTGAVREYVSRRKDGTTFPSTVSTTLMTDEAGNPVGIRGILTDISETKQYEEQLERVNAELESFAQCVSHDLKGPLTAISIAGETMRQVIGKPLRDQTAVELEELVGILADNVYRAGTLVDELLALAEAGQTPSSVVDVDVEEVVKTVLKERAGALKERGFTMQVDDDLGHVIADPTHIYQVFSNLIGNSVKHNDSKKPVLQVRRLSGNRRGAHRYLIRDNGTGIPPDSIKKIFDPFFKGAGTGETGIGLTTVQKIVRLYGGEIRAFNDEGTCFEFSLLDWQSA